MKIQEIEVSRTLQITFKMYDSAESQMQLDLIGSISVRLHCGNTDRNSSRHLPACLDFSGIFTFFLHPLPVCLHLYVVDYKSSQT